MVVASVSCRRDADIPSVYYFHVVDYYYNQPIPNAKAVLRVIYWPAGQADTIIGATDANGDFTYVCDKYSDHTPGNYWWYSIYFIGSNCSVSRTFARPEGIEVTQSHMSQHCTFIPPESALILSQREHLLESGLILFKVITVLFLRNNIF
jgi:hypothetical protein